MKASELMIGDWVFSESISAPAKIIAISPREGLGQKDGYTYILSANNKTLYVHARSISPIAITPEILEKNGFQYTNQHTLKGADTYVLCLEQRGFNFSVTIKLNDYFALDSYDDRMYRLVEIQTGKWYVHDLQHALRLVGIEHGIKI